MNKTRIIRAIMADLIALAIAFSIAALILYLIDVDPLFAFQSLFLGAFGTINGLSSTFIKMSPLLLTGLGVAIAFKCGLANIGAEGQLYIGALIGTAMGLYVVGLHPLVLIPLIIIVCFFMGGVWGLIPGYLKVKFNVSEVITSFMLNFVAIYLVNFMVLKPMKGVFPMLPQTDYINVEAILPILVPGTRIHTGIILGIVSAVIIYLFLERTSLGFEIIATGSQPKAAQWAGINTFRSILSAMFLSGGFAGLAGMTEVLGFQHRLMEGISPGYGYLAIVIALLARNNPIGVIFTSFLFGGLLVGADEMRRLIGIPVGLVYIIEGLVIISVLVFELLLREKE